MQAFLKQIFFEPQAIGIVKLKKQNKTYLIKSYAYELDILKLLPSILLDTFETEFYKQF